MIWFGHIYFIVIRGCKIIQMNCCFKICCIFFFHCWRSTELPKYQGYVKHQTNAKLCIEVEDSLTANTCNTEYIFPRTTVGKFTSATAKITPGYSDKNFHVHVQQEQEPKSGKNHLHVVFIYKITLYLKQKTILGLPFLIRCKMFKCSMNYMQI